MPLRLFDDGLTSLHDRLRQLLDRGVLTIDAACAADLSRVAACERSWRPAGLLAPAHREASAVVVAAGRLAVPIATADADVRRLAQFHGVPTVTAEAFAAAVTA